MHTSGSPRGFPLVWDQCGSALLVEEQEAGKLWGSASRLHCHSSASSSTTGVTAPLAKRVKCSRHSNFQVTGTGERAALWPQQA